MVGMIQVVKNLSGAKFHGFIIAPTEQGERLGGFGDIAPSMGQ
jgi:hypothetical protein